MTDDCLVASYCERRFSAMPACACRRRGDVLSGEASCLGEVGEASGDSTFGGSTTRDGGEGCLGSSFGGSSCLRSFCSLKTCARSMTVARLPVLGIRVCRCCPGAGLLEGSGDVDEVGKATGERGSGLVGFGLVVLGISMDFGISAVSPGRARFPTIPLLGRFSGEDRPPYFKDGVAAGAFTPMTPCPVHRSVIFGFPLGLGDVAVACSG